MKKYLEQLRPLERRMVIAVGVVLLIVLNYLFIWPHLSDWSDLTARYGAAQQKLKSYQAAVAKIPELENSLKKYEEEGVFVAPDDQAINFMRTIGSQASASGFGIQSYSRTSMSTNEFFVNQVQTIVISATEPQLVDFLYKLGNDASMIRVRDLEMQPDQARQRLNANIKLVASYQKNPKLAAAPATHSTTNSTAKVK